MLVLERDPCRWSQCAIDRIQYNTVVLADYLFNDLLPLYPSRLSSDRCVRSWHAMKTSGMSDVDTYRGMA